MYGFSYLKNKLFLIIYVALPFLAHCLNAGEPTEQLPSIELKRVKRMATAFPSLKELAMRSVINAFNPFASATSIDQLKKMREQTTNLPQEISSPLTKLLVSESATLLEKINDAYKCKIDCENDFDRLKMSNTGRFLCGFSKESWWIKHPSNSVLSHELTKLIILDLATKKKIELAGIPKNSSICFSQNDDHFLFHDFVTTANQMALKFYKYDIKKQSFSLICAPESSQAIPLADDFFPGAFHTLAPDNQTVISELGMSMVIISKNGFFHKLKGHQNIIGNEKGDFIFDNSIFTIQRSSNSGSKIKQWPLNNSEGKVILKLNEDRFISKILLNKTGTKLATLMNDTITIYDLSDSTNPPTLLKFKSRVHPHDFDELNLVGFNKTRLSFRSNTDNADNGTYGDIDSESGAFTITKIKNQMEDLPYNKNPLRPLILQENQKRNRFELIHINENGSRKLLRSFDTGHMLNQTGSHILGGRFKPEGQPYCIPTYRSITNYANLSDILGLLIIDRQHREHEKLDQTIVMTLSSSPSNRLQEIAKRYCMSHGAFFLKRTNELLMPQSSTQPHNQAILNMKYAMTNKRLNKRLFIPDTQELTKDYKFVASPLPLLAYSKHMDLTEVIKDQRKSPLKIQKQIQVFDPAAFAIPV